MLTLHGKVKDRRMPFPVPGSTTKTRYMADYYNDENTDFDIVGFYCDLQDSLPLMWILIQKLACVVCTEAGAERLFNTAGYTLRPERSLLLTQTYENLVRGKCNGNVVFVCDDSVVDAYLERDKNKSWSTADDDDDSAYLMFEEGLEVSEE